MKKNFFVILFALIFAGFISAQELPSVTIVNNTGYTIYYMYVSPSSDDNWGSDCLGDAVLYDGSSFKVKLPYRLNQENCYDIKLVDEDDDEYIKMNVVLHRQYSTIEFTFDDID